MTYVAWEGNGGREGAALVESTHRRSYRKSYTHGTPPPYANFRLLTCLRVVKFTSFSRLSGILVRSIYTYTEGLRVPRPASLPPPTPVLFWSLETLNVRRVCSTLHIYRNQDRPAGVVEVRIPEENKEMWVLLITLYIQINLPATIRVGVLENPRSTAG